MAARRPKEPLHRIFYVCSTYTPDEAWSEFLKECSFGKFPKGIRFEGGAIKCTRKRQNFVEYLPKDTEKALQLIIEIFRDRLGIKTAREKKLASDTFEKKRAEKVIASWKDAKTIASKDCLVRSFVNRFSTYYSMSESESRELMLLISLALATKTLNPSRIVIQDSQIIKIEGLIFNQYTRKITMECNKPETTPNIHAVPLDYTPVPQIDYNSKYMQILQYHSNKSGK